MLNKLREEFKCINAEFVPYPSATPAFFQGYHLICKIDGKDINKELCEQCEKYKEGICSEN